MKNKLKVAINKLKKFKPISIFLYGSQARKDYLSDSDFEIGVLFSKRKYVRRAILNKTVDLKGVNIYPFKYEDFIKYRLDTPFQRSIYLRELLLGGETLEGKKVIENLKPPVIKVIDLIQDLRFNIGYALASMHSYRNGDKKTSSYELYKSCLYGARNLEILELKKFPIGFEEIYKVSKKLKLSEYARLVSTAYKLRVNKIKLQEKDIFQNISFLNDFIELKLINYFNKYGNKIVVK